MIISLQLVIKNIILTQNYQGAVKKINITNICSFITYF
jgi:hypothetical protein